MESKKRDIKKALKEEKKKPVEKEPEEEEDEAADLDYSSNEEEEMNRKKSLQRTEPKLPKTVEEKQTSPRLIIILEYA